MALSTASITDAAKILADSVNEGAGSARTSLGGGGAAFGWATGMVPTVAAYATLSTAAGMTYSTTVVSESGTPATVVGAGGAKPNAATLTNSTQSLKKFAAMAVSDLEDHLEARGLGAAMTSILSMSCLKAFEADAVTTIGAAASGPVTGGTWVAAVAAAQAQLLSVGAKPSCLLISADDYAAFTEDVLATNAFAQSPESPVGAVLGTPVHVSVGAAAGTAYMFDSNAVHVVQHETSPVGVLDATTLADSNQYRLVLDVLAHTWVSHSDAVVGITAPVAAAVASSKRK